jgi:hypothetical protein
LAYDEESGKERKTNMYLLIQANDVSITISVMKGTMGDYTSLVLNLLLWMFFLILVEKKGTGTVRKI